MTMTELDYAAIAADLTDDGDTFDLSDGRTLRLKISPDDITIMDEQGAGVWCGRLEWGGSDDHGHHRPDGFDGRAEVIHNDRFDRLWWQVPDDVEIGSDVHASLRQSLRDLIEYGYQYVRLEVCEGEDVYGRPIVRDVASLGAVEPFPDREHLLEIVTELVAEVLA